MPRYHYDRWYVLVVALHIVIAQGMILCILEYFVPVAVPQPKKKVEVSAHRTEEGAWFGPTSI